MLVLKSAVTKTDMAAAVIIVAAVILYSSFSWGLPLGRYNSPDEAANAFFATRLSRGESLAAPAAELNNQLPAPVVHPRSTVVVQGQLAPASFLGWPLLAGWWGKLFGQASIPYVTPILAALGLLSVYLLIKDLFNRQAALITLILTASLPGFWYYHARSLFHNALFFDLLLISAWLTWQSLRRARPGYYLAAGLAVGLALAVRTSEIFWISASGLLWLGLSWRQIKPRYLPWFGLGMLVGFSPILCTNYAIYGQVLSVGYRAGLKSSIPDLRAATSLLGELILPFGFQPRVILSTGWRYLVELTWWWTAVAGLGLGFLLSRWRQLTLEQKAFSLKGFLACGWLVVLYGSWSFHDNPDPTVITLGTSYVRYWLPLYVFMLWPAGWALAQVWQLNRLAKLGVVGLVGVYVILSAGLVLNDPLEGLIKIRSNIKRFETVSQAVVRATEQDSVIVTGNTDKFFWPERLVISSLGKPEDYSLVRRLVDSGRPVYNFHATWLPKDLRRLNEEQLAPHQLKMEPVIMGFQDFSLYKFLSL